MKSSPLFLVIDSLLDGLKLGPRSWISYCSLNWAIILLFLLSSTVQTIVKFLLFAISCPWAVSKKLEQSWSFWRISNCQVLIVRNLLPLLFQEPTLFQFLGDCSRAIGCEQSKLDNCLFFKRDVIDSLFDGLKLGPRSWIAYCSLNWAIILLFLSSSTVYDDIINILDD